jgi:hypothetical protein
LIDFCIAGRSMLATKKEKGTNHFGPTIAIAARSFVCGYLTSATWSFASKKPATGFIDCLFCYEGMEALHMHFRLQPVFRLTGHDKCVFIFLWPLKNNTSLQNKVKIAKIISFPFVSDIYVSQVCFCSNVLCIAIDCNSISLRVLKCSKVCLIASKDNQGSAFIRIAVASSVGNSRFCFRLSVNLVCLSFSKLSMFVICLSAKSVT